MRDNIHNLSSWQGEKEDQPGMYGKHRIKINMQMSNDNV